MPNNSSLQIPNVFHLNANVTTTSLLTPNLNFHSNNDKNYLNGDINVINNLTQSPPSGPSSSSSSFIHPLQPLPPFIITQNDPYQHNHQQHSHLYHHQHHHQHNNSSNNNNNNNNNYNNDNFFIGLSGIGGGNGGDGGGNTIGNADSVGENNNEFSLIKNDTDHNHLQQYHQNHHPSSVNNQTSNNININQNNNINNNNSNNNINNEINCLPPVPESIIFNNNSSDHKNSVFSRTKSKNQHEKNNFLLWIVTPLAASFSVGIVIAALAGPQWLLTEEKMPNTNYNGTANYNLKDDGIYSSKYTKSSLWILCSSFGSDYQCSTIDYFPNEEYSPDPNDSTLAIPYAITRSAPFFLLSGVVLIISYILLLVAICSQQYGILYFVSGIIFIISGLLMLIGIIMYISVFKAEVGYKLRPKSTFQPALFTFKYGQSFLLYVLGFIITEFVGILNVFLYIRLHHSGYDKTSPCFGYVGNGANNIRTIKFSQLPDDLSNYACKKHKVPCLSSIGEKRYYFEKKCDVHQKNLTKSLNELYTEPAPLINPFELPVTKTQHLSQQQPQTPKLTRSVSTATDIFNNGDIQLSPPPSTDIGVGKSSNSGKQLKDNLKTLTNEMCGIRKNVLLKTQNEDRDNRNSKEKIFREIYNKTSSRKKPKDIYYIEDTSNGKDTDVYIIDPDYHQRNNNLKNRSLFSSNRSLDNRYCMRNNFYGGGGSFDDVFDNHRFDNLLPRAAIENRNIYQSRTLPRNFLKKSWDQGMDYDEFMGGRTSANGLFVPFRDDSSMLHGYHNHCRKSFEMPATSSMSTEFLDAPKWPSVIARSPSNYSLKSCSINNLLPPPSEFFLDDYEFERTSSMASKKHKINRNRLNDGEIVNDEDSIEFDLDRIEQERRKSHANLFDTKTTGNSFDDSYDYGKSTAV